MPPQLVEPMRSPEEIKERTAAIRKAKAEWAKTESPQAKSMPAEVYEAFVEAIRALVRELADQFGFAADEIFETATVTHTIQVAAGGEGISIEPSYFTRAPLSAYERPPVFVPEKEGEPAGEAAAWAVQAAGRGVAFSVQGFVSGAQSLLPYRMLYRQSPEDPVTGTAARAYVIPVPALSTSIVEQTDLAALQQLIEAEFLRRWTHGRSGPTEARALARWTAHLLGLGKLLAVVLDLPGEQMSWLAFGEWPPPEGAREKIAAYKKRVRRSFVRAHDGAAGILPWLMKHGLSWHASFSPKIQPFEYAVDRDADAMFALVESHRVRAAKTSATAPQIGAYQFTPPEWFLLTDDPLGDARHGIPSSERAAFEAWADRLLTPQSAASVVFDEAIDGRLKASYDRVEKRAAIPPEDRERVRKEWAVYTMLKTVLNEYAEDGSAVGHEWLRQQELGRPMTATKAQWKEMVASIREAWAALGAAAFGRPEWPGSFRGAVDGKIKELRGVFDPGLSTKVWRGAVYALAALPDPMQDGRAVRSIVLSSGAPWPLFSGVRYDAAAKTVVQPDEPRREFFVTSGVDPLLTCRRVLRAAWEHRKTLPRITTRNDLARRRDELLLARAAGRPNEAAERALEAEITKADAALAASDPVQKGTLEQFATVYLAWAVPSEHDVQDWAKALLQKQSTSHATYADLQKAFRVETDIEAMRAAAEAYAAEQARAGVLPKTLHVPREVAYAVRELAEARSTAGDTEWEKAFREGRPAPSSAYDPDITDESGYQFKRNAATDEAIPTPSARTRGLALWLLAVHNKNLNPRAVVRATKVLDRPRLFLPRTGAPSYQPNLRGPESPEVRAQKAWHLVDAAELNPIAWTFLALS